MNPKKSIFKSLLFFLWFLRRRTLRTLYRSSSSIISRPTPRPKFPPMLADKQTLIFDLEGGLLRSSSTFSYFMLVALESTGGFLRAFLLLILYPFISFLGHELRLSVMVMICFIGVKAEGFSIGKAVLPKYLLEDVGVEGFEVVKKAKKRVCVTSMPTVMVQVFLKEYLEVENVIGRKLKVSNNGYFTGFMEDSLDFHEVKEILVEVSDNSLDDLVWFGGHETSLQLHHQHFMSLCKEVYNSLTEADKKKTWNPLPRSSYPKPLIFHDGRLAFKPTLSSTLSLFLWLPFGFVLAFLRALIGYFLPSHLNVPILAFTGMQNRLLSEPPRKSYDRQQLFVCNHRTLFDPVYVEAVIGRRATAVTYSLSRVSELLSPIRTVRLTRNRDEDKKRMKKIVESNGALVVCPEGTTCREPYLLRFSPLFTEICDEVTPVAMETHVTMFYGTSTSVFKFLDPLYFFMNPWPCYDLEFLDPVATCPGEDRCTGIELANYVQAKIGKALGFECTRLTRKDKYLMLAGNEGVVNDNKK